MKRSKALLVAVAVVTSLMVTVALALAAAPDEPKMVQKMVIALDGGERTTIDLGDLADGESRAFPLDKGQLTASRTGDEIEVVIDDGEGKTKRLLLTAGDGEAKKLFICKLGEEGSANVFVTGEKSHGMTWVSDEGKVIAMGHGEGPEVVTSDGNVVTVTRHVCVKGDVEGAGEETVVMLSSKHDEGKVDVWVSKGDDQAVFTCPDDKTTVVVDAGKVPTAGLSCPVCGKLMDRADHHHGQGVTIEEEKHELL